MFVVLTIVQSITHARFAYRPCFIEILSLPTE